MEHILGIATRSLIRHAVVGVLTGGTGNIFVLAGDLMDISDTMDAMDAVDAVDTISSVDTDSNCSSSSGHDVVFGSNGQDGYYAWGKDSHDNPVAQSGTGPPYNPNNPLEKKSLNEVWPLSSDTAPAK